MGRAAVFFPRCRRQEEKPKEIDTDCEYKAKKYYDEWKAERDYKIAHGIALDYVPSIEEIRESDIKDTCDLIVCLVILYIAFMMCLWFLYRKSNG